MYVVYWLEKDADLGDTGHPMARGFGSEQMKAALDFMEELRSRQRAGQGVGFVAMCSENPDSVGLPGVADPPADYNWKKRRP